MRSRSVTTRLIVYDFHVIQETVGLLSDTERGTSMFASGHTSRKLSSLRMRAAISRLDLVSVLPGLVTDTKYAMMSVSQGWCHMMIEQDLEGSSHTPPAPIPEVSHNPR